MILVVSPISDMGTIRLIQTTGGASAQSREAVVLRAIVQPLVH
jgi:hypothetical protein